MSNSYNFNPNNFNKINSDLENILSKIQNTTHTEKESTLLENPVILKELAQINHALYVSHLEKIIHRIKVYSERGGNIAGLLYDMEKMLKTRYKKDFKKLQQNDQTAFAITARTELKAIVSMLQTVESFKK